MSKKTEYILTGKQRISSTGSETHEKGQILSAAEVKKLSKRQQGFFEPFNEKNPKHRALTDRLYDTVRLEEQAQAAAEAEKSAAGDTDSEDNEDPAEPNKDKEEQKKSDSGSAGERTEKES